MKVRYKDLCKKYPDVCVLSDLPFYFEYFDKWADDVVVKFEDAYNGWDYNNLIKLFAIKNISIKDITYSWRELCRESNGCIVLKDYVNDYIFEDIAYEGIDFEVEISPGFIELIYERMKYMDKERFVRETLRNISDDVIFEVARHLKIGDSVNFQTLGDWLDYDDGENFAFENIIAKKFLRFNKPKMFKAVAQIVIRDLEMK